MGVVPMTHWVLINGPSSDIVKVGVGEWAVMRVVEGRQHVVQCVGACVCVCVWVHACGWVGACMGVGLCVCVCVCVAGGVWWHSDIH